MNIALIGYGKMGKEIEEVLKSGQHAIVSINYKNKEDKLDLEGIKKADVAIDFTSPEIVLSTIEQILSVGTNMVIGTTGWYSDLPKVKDLVKKYNLGLIYGSNFSIGANVFFKITNFASKLLSRFPSYDVAGVETHHTGKKDSPSGTAKKLGVIIMKNMTAKKKLINTSFDRQIKEEELHFASVRLGQNPGRHEIIFDSVADEIRLTHQAHGRRGFALGAIMAAEFIKGRKGVYSFEEIF